MLGQRDVILSADPIPLSTWVHVACVADGNEQRVYVDGSLVNSGPVDTPMTRVLHTEKFRKEYTDAIPMGRYGEPSFIIYETDSAGFKRIRI